MATTEFLISEALNHESGLLVRGICNLGDVRPGQIFTELASDNGDSEEVALTVSKIIAYRREIDDLPTGMTAELHLEGGCSELKHGDMLKAR